MSEGMGGGIWAGEGRKTGAHTRRPGRKDAGVRSFHNGVKYLGVETPAD